jgi:hypothetical protein
MSDCHTYLLPCRVFRAYVADHKVLILDYKTAASYEEQTNLSFLQQRESVMSAV